ncbi:chloride channel protein [Segetibacter sp. 3557_3]|nr:chloride channel protein [Segetibacter sp. 3557_3]TDH25593.1 chloride channel protein [Segetibacter sp. 3557_3]
MLMVVGGAAIGREGPTIQIAGCIFRKVNQLIPKSWPQVSKKNMIMTGAAAGLAAAFNTPLGGIVFAVEELTRTHINYFKIAILSAVIIAGLTAQALLGPYLYLGFPNVSNLSPYIFFAVIAASTIAGFAGGLMSKWIVGILKWKSRLKKISWEIAYVLGCAVVLVLIAMFLNDSVLGSGKEQMTNLLFTDEKYGGWLAPVLRIIGPLLSFTTGAAGGVFAPSLSAGACIGSWCAEMFELSNTNSNLLILAGMVAFLTGVTRSPFTSAILVLEMTDRHSVIFHLMLAGIVAVVVASLVDRRSLYDHLKHQYMNDLENDDIRAGGVDDKTKDKGAAR